MGITGKWNVGCVTDNGSEFFEYNGKKIQTIDYGLQTKEDAINVAKEYEMSDIREASRHRCETRLTQYVVWKSTNDSDEFADCIEFL